MAEVCHFLSRLEFPTIKFQLFCGKLLLPTPPTSPQPLPLVAVARYNSVLGPLEHFPHVLGNNDYTVTQISSTSISRSWCKCMSASPNNRSSDIRHSMASAPPVQLQLLIFNFTGFDLVDGKTLSTELSPKLSTS